MTHLYEVLGLVNTYNQLKPTKKCKEIFFHKKNFDLSIKKELNHIVKITFTYLFFNCYFYDTYDVCRSVLTKKCYYSTYILYKIINCI